MFVGSLDLGAHLSRNESSSRILVGICGIPASGKTTLALNVVERINSSYQKPPAEAIAIAISQDGWHLPRSALDQFPDVKNAYDRRGAAFTFDGFAFNSFILSLQKSSNSEVTLEATQGLATSTNDIIYAPSFSHTLKDPTENSIAIHPNHKIVIVEGLYTFLGIDPWKEAAEALDERWFVDIDETQARERLIRRHVATGVAKNSEEAIWRADSNDLPNGRFIKENMLAPTRVIHSVDDPVLASHGRVE